MNNNSCPKGYHCRLQICSIDNTLERASLRSSILSGFILPILLINLFSDIERIWKQSATDSLTRLLMVSGEILTIHGTFSYRSFQSVKGTITFSGNFPKELSLTTMAGLVFLSSAPIVGSRDISHISPCFIE